MVRFAAAVLLGALALGAPMAATAQNAPPRMIAPEQFAPTPRDPTAARAPIVMPTRDHPYGACDRAAHDWLACLDETARLSDHAVEDAEAPIVSGLAQRPRLNPVVRSSLARALPAVDRMWRDLRDAECGELTMIENGLPSSLFEARLICRIHRNLDRVDALNARYGAAP